MSTNNSKSMFSDPKEVKKGMLGIAVFGVALAPFTGGASLMYAVGNIAVAGAVAAHEQSKDSN